MSAATERRRRLFNPPNAVVDLGIDLKRVPSPEQPAEDGAVPQDSATIHHIHHEKLLVDAVARMNDEIMSLKVLLAENGIVPRTPDKPRVLVLDIKRAVCAEFGIDASDFDSRRQNRHISMGRHAAVFLAKRLTTHSLHEIGRRLGGRDHTTAMNSVTRAEALIEQDADFADRVRRLQFMLLEAAHV